MSEFRCVVGELWSRSQPPGQRVEDKADWCVEFLRQYRPEVLAESFWDRALESL